MIFPIKDNQEYYLKLVNQMRKEKQFDIINHHFTTIFETNFEKEEIFLSNNKVLWNCGHKNEVLNNFMPLNSVPLGLINSIFVKPFEFIKFLS